MNFELIGHLIRLRYKLLWAKRRTRGGKIVLFMAGYLLLVGAMAVLAAGGLGAGILAVKTGQAERIAQGVLTGLFAWAVITSVMLGFGMNAAFTDAELRRYPLKSRERRFARHFTGAVDPFWFLFLALEAGLAFGLYLFGAANLLLGLLAALLLYVCCYLAAQVVGLLLERLMQRRGGSMILPLIVVVLCLLPSAAAPWLEKNSGSGRDVVRALGYTPAFGAGALMTRADAAGLYGFGLVAWWTLGLAGALAAMERRPPKPAAAQTARLQWDTRFERIGEKFGPEYGPLVAHWLLFYSRCKRLRISYLLSVPLIPFLMFVFTQQVGKRHVFDPFAAGVGVFAVCGFLPLAAGVVNIYGYVGSGFRRFFLLPGDPGRSLRAASYTLITLCLPGLLVATLAWLVHPPAPYDAKAMIMLLSTGVAGTFLFHGVGLWTTLYGPRRGDPNATMGNDLSAAGNVVLIGGMLGMLLGIRFLAAAWKGSVTPDHWWWSVIVASLAAVFYFTSLKAAETALPARRERLLALLEGKA